LPRAYKLVVWVMGYTSFSHCQECGSTESPSILCVRIVPVKRSGREKQWIVS
jgi:hypothetical protein